MRIVFIASGEFALPTLRSLSQSDHEIPLVITQPARPSGRGRRVTRTAVHQLAMEVGLDTLEAEDVNDPAVIERVRALDARLGLVIAFGQKLGDRFLRSMPGGCINLHASLLPKYRGAAPINWAIVRGEEETGCTVFRIVQRMDAGPILITRSTGIKAEETAGELHDRLATIGVDAVEAALALYEGGALPEGTPQDDSRATTAPKLTKRLGAIDFSRPVAEIVRHVCAMTPWPGARARFQSCEGRWEIVSVLRARKAEGDTRPTEPPGTIDARRRVAAADGYVEILELKPSSGRVMAWSDYVNGRHVKAGDSFVNPDT